MTLHEKCISVGKAVTDTLLRSKSMKVALMATIRPGENAHFVACCHVRGLMSKEGRDFFTLQLLDRNQTLTFSRHNTAYSSGQSISEAL